MTQKWTSPLKNTQKSKIRAPLKDITQDVVPKKAKTNGNFLGLLTEKKPTLNKMR